VELGEGRAVEPEQAPLRKSKPGPLASRVGKKLEQHLSLAGLVDAEAEAYIANQSRVEKLLKEKP
jgi:hypothetical protein